MEPVPFRSWSKSSTFRVGATLTAAAVIAVAIAVALADDEPRTDAPLPVIAAAVLAAQAVPMTEHQAVVPEEPPTPLVAHRDDEVEVCGIGWMAASSSGMPEDAAVVAAPGISEARRTIGAAMATSSDEFARAVSLWLGLGDEAVAAELRNDRLAREASATDDPRVYALAFRNCLTRPEEGACAMLSTQQWARLDPGNAMPWLFALESAVTRHDTEARNDAIHQISVAPRIEDRVFAAAATIVDHAADDDRSALAAWMLAVGAFGTTAAQTMPLRTLMQSCGRAELSDANRRQVCSAIAELFIQRSDSFLLQTIGRGLDRRLGNEVERLEQSRREISALGAATISTSLACADLRRELRRFQRAFQIGEAQAMHEQVSSATVYSAAPRAR